MEVTLKTLTMAMLLLMAASTFPQSRPRKFDLPNSYCKGKVQILNFPQFQMGAKPKWSIRCDCSSDWIEPSIKPFQDIKDLRWVYQDYVCPKCSVRWRLKLYAETNEILRCPQKIKPTNSNDKVTTIHKTDSFKCYKIKKEEWNDGYIRIEVDRRGCECTYPYLYVVIHKLEQGKIINDFYAIPENDCLSLPIPEGSQDPECSHSQKDIERKFGGQKILWKAP